MEKGNRLKTASRELQGGETHRESKTQGLRASTGRAVGKT